jgi:Ni/Co efflux regulator RcnB
MRKLIFAGLMAATLVPTIASAQNRELRDDRQDIRQEQRDVRRAVRNGDSPREIRDQQRDVRDARQEYRNDWQDYRRRSPDIFRGPAYVGPRGYAYRGIAPGYRFDRGYYDRRYWVDPYRYRLPAAAYGRRWIRYGNDVVLVDIRTGRAITVYNSFFF